MNCKDDVEEQFIRDWNEGKVKRVSDGKIMQREWVGLTDKEVTERANKFRDPETYLRGVLWAEAKLKEKNT